MGKKILFLFLFLFYFTVCFAQALPTDNTFKKNEINLLVSQIQEAEDLSLFTHFILNNNNYVYYYIPKTYSKGRYLYKLIIASTVVDFVDFLVEPKTGFVLSKGSVDSNSIEVSFRRTGVISSNYPTFFEGSKLAEGIELFFDTSKDYNIWQPDMLEAEKNNSFVSNNPIQIKSKIFGTLNGKKDRDFYSINTFGIKYKISILALNQAKYLVKIYNDKFILIQEFLLKKDQPENLITLKNLSNTKLVYVEITSLDSKSITQRSKVFNLNYIFSILDER